MVAILVDSRQNGRTGWVATRGLCRVKAAGLAGCKVKLRCLPMAETVQIVEDGEYDLPDGTESVNAEHIETNSESRVFVDLVR